MWTGALPDDYNRSALLGYHWFGPRCHCEDRETGSVFLLGAPVPLLISLWRQLQWWELECRQDPTLWVSVAYSLHSTFCQEECIVYPSLASIPVSLASHTSVTASVSWEEKLRVFLVLSLPFLFSSRDLPADWEQAIWCCSLLWILGGSLQNIHTGLQFHYCLCLPVQSCLILECSGRSLIVSHWSHVL